ncbi:Ldh family oxidoreductase [Pseudomonas sp. CCI3.2]|uniref:Ldh family oxidoreductase n=1 Tax=unclassified Pseudomonas TaxID=196821 RepID=UPI002AC989F4|nr:MULTISPECIES: Ldh family oxidoreductase [unclassified Pseudomonas]MEB0076624.1 Ldh family oxidoreductase [Pseudomonas sp. MH10out]MEB0100712.1 Ldh family oxidoreductase [Pseudomonas sp. CCI3.2]MEB0130327.1 Ldh family oxidoreductase [Pseudomonas sp. CCI2.4]MEB0158855.1 Ldh family oxidoreductase [Pseudomonas sp. AH2 (2023)]MEB0169867.1 Ldh family oxidoreductase [Pseudomonas sp. CCC4.4]
MISLTLAQARDLAENIMRIHGFSEGHVRTVANAVVTAEGDACASHGLWRLLGCISSLKAAKVIPDALPEVADWAAAVVKVDGRGGFAGLAFEAGMPLLVSKARSQGIAILAINHCVHFSALWAEIEPLTAQGLVALAFTPSHAWVAPAGGSKPLFGTNPIAFGWPRAGQHPFVFDFATSAVARGEIELHRRAGKEIPLGWGLDAQGLPTADPAAALSGAMLTFGGHKGSALAAMVELLAGPLIGDMTSKESQAFDAGSKSSPYGGELVIAIDPQRLLGVSAEEHLLRAEALFDGIVEQGARLPSQRRFDARALSRTDGVQIPEALYQDLMALL